MNDFLSHVHFANLADYVFARNIFPDTPGEGIITVGLNTSFNIKSGDIVYSKYEFLGPLLEILSRQNSLTDLKLISHESDRGVTKELFDLKPTCITKWYAQNVEYEHRDLIPIPLGLSASYYSKTHMVSPPEKKFDGPKETLLYINHRIETHPTSRQWIYDHFKNVDWCTVDLPNLKKEEYLKRLETHKFILCPRGNGVDTCRLWESLYYGMIPIVEDHLTYKTLDDLPAIRVKSFKDVNKDFLLKKEEEFKNRKFNLDKLKASWWINLIRK
jgi:hypothetical protein